MGHLHVAFLALFAILSVAGCNKKTDGPASGAVSTAPVAITVDGDGLDRKSVV